MSEFNAKEKFIIDFSEDESKFKTASQEEIDKYVEVVKELAEQDNEIALDALGYNSYTGNRAFEQDWKTAEKCFLKLVEISDNPFYANTLGYIYYYERVGKPDYEKAFYYFSIGAIAGVYESKYKIADMLIKGRPKVKNIRLAGEILLELYYENIEMFKNKEFNCKFADIALRMGSYVKDIIIPSDDKFFGWDHEDVMTFYLQAKFALEMRMKTLDYYGDATVMKNIERVIQEVSPSIAFQNDLSMLRDVSLSKLLLTSSKSESIVKAKISPDKRKITFTMHGMDPNKTSHDFFITIPDAKFCNFVSTFDVVLDEGAEIQTFNKPNTSNKDTYIINHVENGIFGNEETPFFQITGKYVIDLKL